MKEYPQLFVKYRNEETKFETINRRMKERIFKLMHILLQQNNVTLWAEVLLFIIQMIQMFGFPFSLIVIEYT